MDPLIGAAIIAAVASLASAGITAKQNKAIKETHKQVSENSHKNDKPTVLDLISELRDEQRRTNAVIIDHLEWHVEEKK
jgi:flagellar motor component MotA